MAQADLSFAKAIGIDHLADLLYKKDEFWDIIATRLMNTFNKWIELNKIPEYLNTARIVSLSKEDNNQYPELGNIRTISILPSTSKLLE